jgi:streptomycin 6-kinase
VIIASVLNQLHSAPGAPPAEGLYTLPRWFRELFQQADADEAAGIDTLYRRGAKVAAELLANPRDIRVLHGDIHHQNIRHSERGWLALDPKGLVGERTYDLANTFCNPGGIDLDALIEDETRILRTAALFSEKLGVEQGRILAFVFAYACLSAAWSAHDRGDPAAALRIAALVEPHVPFPLR